MTAPVPERGPPGWIAARLGCAGFAACAVLVALLPDDAAAAPTTRVAALAPPAASTLLASPLLASPRARDALALDATFWSLARGGPATALLAPPSRLPRRLTGDGTTETPPETPTAPASTAPASSAPASSPVPSGSPPPLLAPGTPTIPSPTGVPQPAPGTLEADADADVQSGGATADDVARSLSRESGPPPSEAAEDEVVEQRFLRGRSVPPFWIDRTWTTHRTRALTLPPFFIHRSAGPKNPDMLFHFDLSLTTGWYSQKAQKRRYLAPLGLFFGSFSERTTAWGLGVLLMGYKRVGEQFNFGQFPLVWRWGNKQVKNLVVVPFHYHQKTPDSLRGFDLILFWYGHKNTTDDDPQNDLRYFVGAPVFLRLTQGVKRLTLGLPVYAGWRNKAAGVVHHTVFPFAHWGTHEFGNRRDLYTLLFIKKSDEARRRRAWAIPPLVVFQTRNPERSLTAITPLVWRSENIVRGTTAWAAFPWVSYRDPEQQNRVLFPLFWQFGDRRTGATTSVVFPLFGLTTRPNQGFTLGITPLLTFARRDVNGRSFQVVTPLFWRFRDKNAYAGKGSQQIVAPPLFVYNQQGARRDVGVLPALSFVGRDETRRWQIFAPLLFGHVHDSDPARWHDTWAFGPFYLRRKNPGWHAGLLPLFAAGSDKVQRYTVVPPLLFGDVTNLAEGRRTTISPLFARQTTRDGGRTLGVLNLFWDVKRANDERHTVMFPLLYRRQHGERVLTITPLGGGLKTRDRATWMATPLLYGARDRDGKRASFGFIPLAFYDRRPVDGGVATNLVTPLFARHRAPAEDLDMFSPLIWRTATRGEKPRKNLAVFPFYFRQRQPGGVDVDAGIVLPFFSSRDPARHTHTTIAGPFFHRLSRKQLNTGIVPLYWWHDSAERRRLISLPIIVHIADKAKLEHTTIALPLWFDRRKANGRRTWVALPFVLGTKGQHNFTRFSLAPPGFVDAYRLGKNFRFTGYAPLLFRYQKCGFREEDDDRCRYTLWGSFPLFFAGKDGLGRRTHSALGLYYFDKDKGGSKFLTLLGGAIVRPTERLTWYALNVGRTVTRTHTTTVVFPLFFQKNHRTEKRGTTVVLGPLFVERRKEDYRWFQTSLLVWHFRRPHKVTTAVLPPIFLGIHSYAERRLFWLLPLVVRDDHWAKDKTFTMVPPGLVFQRRNGENNDWVQFPLLWHIERGNNSGTVGAAVWWDIRRKGTTTQVIPALFTRHVRKNGRETSVVGPGLGWWHRQHGDEPSLHWRALFGAFGGGNEAGQRYFSLFGGKIKLKPKPVWVPRRKPAPAAKPTKPAEPPTQPLQPAPTRPPPPTQSLTPAPAPTSTTGTGSTGSTLPPARPTTPPTSTPTPPPETVSPSSSSGTRSSPSAPPSAPATPASPSNNPSPTPKPG